MKRGAAAARRVRRWGQRVRAYHWLAARDFPEPVAPVKRSPLGLPVTAGRQDLREIQVAGRVSGREHGTKER
jgi:hypothetical protein